MRMDPSCPLRSSSCGLLGLSVGEILHHRRPVLRSSGRPASRQHNTKEMPSNGKNHKKEFKCSPLTTDRCEIIMRGRVETGKYEFLNHKPALLLVNSVPKYPQIVSSCNHRVPLPRDHTGPQMEKCSFLENECLLLAIEKSGAN